MPLDSEKKLHKISDAGECKTIPKTSPVLTPRASI
jgi:hypothetical protein